MKDQSDVDGRIEEAALACARDGGRLTDIRREVLELILTARSPVGAYTLLDRLKDTRPKAAPPTVYRALDFLLQHGLIHRIERLNAFVACDDAAHPDHAVQFLICRRCGHVNEVEDKGIEVALRHVADMRGFTPSHATVEVEGTCAACAEGSGQACLGERQAAE